MSEAELLSERASDREVVLARRHVSRETLARLDVFVALLLKWQVSINLVAPSTLGHLWTRHIEDGLALFRLAPDGALWADLGSGGGLPGLVLAAQMVGTDASVDLVESNGKKAAFLRTVVRELNLPARVHAIRIEDAGAILASADIVTARALAPLDQLLRWVAADLRPNARCLFPKGREHAGEIREASANWQFDMVNHDPKTDAGSVVLELTGIRPIGIAE